MVGISSTSPSPLPGGSGSFEGQVHAQQAAHEKEQESSGKKRLEERQLEQARGLVATAIIQELSGKFPTNEMAQGLRKDNEFIEFYAALTADLMSQIDESLTSLPLIFEDLNQVSFALKNKKFKVGNNIVGLQKHTIALLEKLEQRIGSDF